MNKERRYRAAVIGLGRMGAFASETIRQHAPESWWPLSHCGAVQNNSRLVLASVCDLSPAQLQRAVEAFPGAKGYARYQDLLSEQSPDLVTIATRTRERPDVIDGVLQAGVKALHLEKPLCNSMAQLEILERLMRPADTFMTYGTIRRYMPVYRKALSIVESREYGALENIQVECGLAPLMWTHPHSFDLLLLFAGSREVKSVAAHFASGSVTANGARLDGDPIVLSALVEFEGGLTGIISPTGNYDLKLSCSKGSVAVESDGHALSRRYGTGEGPYWQRWDREATGKEPGGTGFALQSLVSQLDGNGSDGDRQDRLAMLTGQRMVFACCQSHLEGGRSVRLSEIDPSLSINGRTGGVFA